MLKIIIMYALNYIILSRTYSISLNYPFLVTNQSVISYMKSDLNGNYIMQLENGTVVRYNPTLTAYQIVPYPYKIETMSDYSFSFNVKLQNGSITTSPGIYQSVIYNNFTSLNFHNGVTYAVLSSYNFNDTILSTFGLAAYVPNTTATPHNIIVCKNSIKVIYQSQIYTIYNYSTIFGNNITAISAQCLHIPGGGATLLGWLNQTYNCYISTSNFKFYIFTLTVNLLFNEATQILDYDSVTASKTKLYTFTETIVKMIYNDFANVIIMQSLSNNYYFYNTNTSLFGTGSSNLSNFVMHQLFNNLNNLYILSKTGLIQINLPTNSTNSLVLLAVVNLLPLNNYELVFGYIDLLYIISGPNVYKAGPCLGQLYQSNSACVSYSCTMNNCSFCPINNQTCGTCNNGYLRNGSFLCNLNNSTNSLSINQTNSTNITNTTNQENQIKLTDQTDSSNFIFGLVFSDFLLELLNYLLTFLQVVISVPGARAAITPIFYLFGNFDNLFFYQFHDRTYNSVVNDFFNQLNNLETKKWDLVNTTDMISRIGNFEYLYNLTNFQQSYQQFNYTSNTLNAGQSEGLFYNSQNYFAGTLPIVIGFFCLFHFLFFLLFNFSISKIIRKFQFWTFLLLIQLDGNVQQLIFYLSCEWISIFAFNYIQKLLKVAIIYYGFVLIFASCSVYYLFRWLNKPKSSVLIDDVKNSTAGIFYVTVELGLKNIFFGAANYFCRLLPYSTLISVLLVGEMTMLSLIFFFKSQFSKSLCKMWLGVILSLLRISFIVTLILDFERYDIQVENCQFILIALMIAVFILGIVVGLKEIIQKYPQFFYRKCCKSNKIFGQDKKTKLSIQSQRKGQIKRNIIKTNKITHQYAGPIVQQHNKYKQPNEFHQKQNKLDKESNKKTCNKICKTKKNNFIVVLKNNKHQNICMLTMKTNYNIK